MIHFRSWITPPQNGNGRVALVFQSKDLDEAMRYFRESGVSFSENKSWATRAISITDPTGVVADLVERK
jgi:hypothetical protein